MDKCRIYKKFGSPSRWKYKYRKYLYMCERNVRKFYSKKWVWKDLDLSKQILHNTQRINQLKTMSCD